MERSDALATAVSVAVALSVGAVAAGQSFPLDKTPPSDLRQPPDGAARTGSGLVSRVLLPGDGERHPDDNDVVIVDYVGWTPEGQVFQSSEGRPQGVRFELHQVFPGWREALKLMVSGEARRVWIPEELGPTKVKRGPRGTVVFDILLRGFLDVPDLEPGLAAPPEGTERLANGVYSRVLEEGEGGERPGPSSLVWLHYTGWTTDGTTFDSTARRARPTVMPLDKVLPAFAEAVQEMAAGERRMLWIPGEVAAGQWVGSPSGMLIFDVELVAISGSAEPSPEAGEAAVQAPGSGW